MDVVDRIDALAKAKGWARSEVFRRAEIHPSAATDWRKGKSKPGKHLAKLAEVLGTTELYLAGGTDDPRPDDIDELEYAMLDGYRKLTDEQKLRLVQLIQEIGRNEK